MWVPPSVVLPGVLAFNDKVSHEWFAPAGLNRGGIETAIMAERKLTQNDRDSLYLFFQHIPMNILNKPI